MSGIPILTLLTLLPLAGAVIAIFSGRRARGVALLTALATLAVALYIWTSIPSNGWRPGCGRSRGPCSSSRTTAISSTA